VDLNPSDFHRRYAATHQVVSDTVPATVLLDLGIMGVAMG